MLTRREVVIEKPFQDRRYDNHRRKVVLNLCSDESLRKEFWALDLVVDVKSALPRIDTGPPPRYAHLDVKMKKLRLEKDRQEKICEDNIRLVHKMAIIMRTKRMDDINTSSRGPFEKKKSALPRRMKVKPQSEELEPPSGTSFLEKVTKEAMKMAPFSKKKVIQHRAPHGFCRVPELGFTFLSSTGLWSRKERRDIYSIKSSPLKRQMKSMESTSDDHLFSHIELHNKSTQISLSDFNLTSESSTFTSQTSFNERTTIDEADDFDEYSETFSDEDQESDHEIARKIIDQSETGSSEAEDDSVLSCSGFTEIENSNSKKDDKGKGTESSSPQNSLDSDEHVTSVLLGPTTPSITIDEPSDDDFFDC